MFLCWSCYVIIDSEQTIGFNFKDNSNNNCYICDNCFLCIDSKLKPEIDKSKLILLKAKVNRINEQRSLST